MFRFASPNLLLSLSCHLGFSFPLQSCLNGNFFFLLGGGGETTQQLDTFQNEVKLTVENS